MQESCYCGRTGDLSWTVTAGGRCGVLTKPAGTWTIWSGFPRKQAFSCGRRRNRREV